MTHNTILDDAEDACMDDTCQASHGLGKNPTKSGSNPTIVSYNANAGKIYNASSSLVHFEKKYLIFC
jgi:hypothetical protein